MSIKNTVNGLFDFCFPMEVRPSFGHLETHRNERLCDGELHCIDEPALTITAADDGRLLLEAWYIDGALHREGDKPALTRWDPTTGHIVESCWYVEGKLHREKRPAVILRPGDDPHAVSEYRRYRHGKLHGSHGECAEMIFDPRSGEWLQQSFYEDGVRVGGPIYNHDAGRLNRLLNSP